MSDVADLEFWNVFNSNSNIEFVLGDQGTRARDHKWGTKRLTYDLEH